MPVKYPMGRERPRGRCRECGGQVVLRWRDKLTGEYFCKACGLVSSVAGTYPTSPSAESRLVIDQCYAELVKTHGRRLSLHGLVATADVVMMRRYNQHVRVTQNLLETWGYEVVCGLIERK